MKTAAKATSRPAKLAFSLVELSIVLVILGLLVGGILAGQSLIRAAELRSVSTQFQKHIAATYAFRDKYFALPGDMSNAQSFWGVADADPATCVTTSSSTALTCNGDGNSQVEKSAAGSNEVFRFWQHLANAGMLEGQFTGVSGSGNTYTAVAANVPAGRMAGSLWMVDYFGGTVYSGASAFDGNYGHYFMFGGAYTNTLPVGNLFKPEELWNIDTKLDDGKPATGKLVAYAVGGLSTCTTTVADSTTTLTASYLLSSSSVVCVAMFRQLF